MLYQIRIPRKGMGTIRGPDASFGFALGLETQFAHEAFYAFMIDAPSLPLQLLGDAPIAIAGPLASHGYNGLAQLLFISLLSVMVIGTASKLQDFANLGDRILLCQHLHHHPFLLAGELKIAEAFFAISSCSVSRPTTRSSSAIRSCS